MSECLQVKDNKNLDNEIQSTMSFKLPLYCIYSILITFRSVVKIMHIIYVFAVARINILIRKHGIDR